MDWLNINTLIGFTDQRGNAWHYRIELQGLESNHYGGPIPIDDVLRRLFNFEVRDQAIYVLTDRGYVEIPGRKAMVTSDTEDVLGIFKQGYQGHQYQEWLLENVATVLDDTDELGIGSAGLLRNRAQAWVSIEVPENIITPEGVEFRPNLLACTSFDGSLATTYKRVNTRVVCDNTAEAARSEEGQQFKTKHTKYSGFKIQSARDALQIVHTMADEFSAEIKALCEWKVSDAEFAAHLAIMVPEPDADAAQSAHTKFDNKRGEIVSLYNYDLRVAPWKGTAFGVAQAYNTWQHHYAVVRKGVPRAVRNMENTLNGKMGNMDAQVLEVLRTVSV
jgi:phage/plasmid-like protein (TIGR03299 family)